MSPSTQHHPRTSSHSEATSTAVKQPVPSTCTQQQHHAHISLHSQRVHPHSAATTTTTTRQHVKPVPATRPRQPDSAPKLPPVAFILDSNLKAVVEDNDTQSTMIASDWEQHLLLFRGKPSDETVKLSQDQLLKLKSSGVKNSLHPLAH